MQICEQKKYVLMLNLPNQMFLEPFWFYKKLINVIRNMKIEILKHLV